jgi:hypothetical protein
MFSPTSIVTILCSISTLSALVSIAIYIHLFTLPIRLRWDYDFLENNLEFIEQNPFLTRNLYVSRLKHDIVPESHFMHPFTPSTNSGNHTALMNPILNTSSRSSPILPSESILDNEFVLNLSIQPLTLNPSKYRYFSIHRVEGFMSDRSRKDVNYNYHSSYILTSCFSDWFPLELISDQDNNPAQDIPSQNNPWDLFSDEYNQKLAKYQVNMDKIDKDKLAKYYGYSSYDDMPYHPRVPLSNPNNNIKWVHRCVTPWQFDHQLTPSHDYSYFSLFDQNRAPGQIQTGPLGADEPRIWYDRCGRLKLSYSTFNHNTPIYPDIATTVVDGRRIDDRLQFPQLSFCESEQYIYPSHVNTMNSSTFGRSKKIEIGQAELPYGFGYDDLNNMFKLVQLFETKSLFFDQKTNSYLFSPQNYQQFLHDRIDTHIKSIPAAKWDYIERHFRLGWNGNISNTPFLQSYQTLLNLEAQFTYDDPPEPYFPMYKYAKLSDQEAFDDLKKIWETERKDRISNLQRIYWMRDETMPHREINSYLYQSDPFIMNASPMVIRNSTLHIIENNNSLQKCVFNFDKKNHSKNIPQFFTHFSPNSFQFSTNFNLIRLNPGDNVQNVSNISEWVYWAIGHDNSNINDFDDYRQYSNKRPIIVMYDAITLKLIGIHPLNLSNKNDCPNQPDYCYNGTFNSGCQHDCLHSYVHSIFPIQTPLSMSVSTTLGDNNSINFDIKNTFNHTLHTVLPTWHTVDTQWVMSLNTNGKTVLKELNLRAVWEQLFSCDVNAVENNGKNEQHQQNEQNLNFSLQNWKNVEYLDDDYFDLKFAFQQHPRRIFEFLPLSLDPHPTRSFVSWEEHHSLLREARFWVIFSLVITFFCFFFYSFVKPATMYPKPSLFSQPPPVEVFGIDQE